MNATATKPRRPATLLEITDDLAALLDLLDESGGEFTGAAGAALDTWFAELGDAFAAKVDGYAGLIRNLELRAAARRKEVERLMKRVCADENAAEHLKRRLRDHMERLGIKKQETARYTVSVQANGGMQAVDVMVPAQELPADYQRVAVTADVDAIRKALLAGDEVEGCVLAQRGTHLRIR